MYCEKCGSKLDNGVSFCSECGNKINISDNNIQKNESSSSSFGWGVLGFFVPIAGLILFLTWRQDRQNDAKAAGIGALIFVGIYILILILIFLLAFISGYSSVYY